MHDTTTTAPTAPAGHLARALLAAGAAVTAAAVLRTGTASPGDALTALEGQVLVLALGALGPVLLHVGVLLLVHRRVRQLVPTTWCDGPVLALLLSAAAGAVVLPWFRAASGASAALGWVLVERTVLDLLVASLAVGACTVLSRSPDRRLVVLAAATSAVAVVDLVEVVHLTGVLGESAGWALGWGRVLLLLALGAVLVLGALPLDPPAPAAGRPLVGVTATLVGPVLSLVLVAAVFALVDVRGASSAVVVLTVLGLTGLGVRLVLVLHELVRVTALAAAPAAPGGTPGAAGTAAEAAAGTAGAAAPTGTAAVAAALDAAARTAPVDPPAVGGRPRVAAPLFRRRTEDAPGGGAAVVGRPALSRDLARAAAAGRAVHVVVLDLHGLDVLEDHHGAAAAARLVQRTGQLLRAVAGPDALVARTGTAEHAVLVPGDVVASGLAHRLVAAVGATAAGHDPDGRLVIGAGVAGRVFAVGSSPDAGEDLLGRAQTAARASRVAGGGVTVDGFRTAPRPAGRRAAPPREDVTAPPREEAAEPWLLELRARREAVAASTTSDAAW